MNFKIGLVALASIIGSVSALYAAGPCMNEVYLAAGGSGSTLSCTAKEVTTNVLGIDGPTACKKGDIINVNITTSIYFRASRYDFSIYTLTDNSGLSDPIFGSECAVDVLGQDDADYAPDNIVNEDGDACFDVVAKNGWTLENFKFQENLHVPCEGEPGTTTQTVHVQNCFSWRTSGQDEVCDGDRPAYPGSSPKCECASMDLGILIYEEAFPSSKPSSSPSTSTLPSSVPSLAPSTSSAPSNFPSALPTISTVPSNQPSFHPSISTMPSSVPSLAPSTSSSPSSLPSVEPSTSKAPSNQPSSPPSLSQQPSNEPTTSPSSSTSPSTNPSSAPSISAMPSSQPSSSPSVSTLPSSVPTLAPSSSSGPSPQPSLSPSISTMPSSSPSSSPSVSAAPTSQPSLDPTLSSQPSSSPSSSPSISTMPSSQPSSSPSISAAPSSEPSLNPSLSSKPSSAPSLSPSVSAAPSSQPSLDPTTSSQPSSAPSSSPSISTMPSSQPSSSPSISAAPSSSPSLNPSLSSEPSSAPSLSPSISAMPSSSPSSSPSISAAPSSEPSLNPSLTSEPSSAPSLSPSISTMPSSDPSLSPSISTMPSSSPSSSPSISAAPSSQPSLDPTTSSQPSSTPSSSPSISTMPSSQPSSQPSISAAPSSEPSFIPSTSTAPSSNPTLTPSESPSSSPTSVAGIGGVVWDDLNGDGLIDDGETLLVDVEVSLLDEEKNVVQTTASASDGSYFFSGVLPDTYSITVQSGEYIFSPIVSGGNQIRSSAAVSGDAQIMQLMESSSGQGASDPITVSGGEERNDIHAGMYKPITIGNKVWNDLNGNGIQEIGENGIPSVQVDLLDVTGMVIENTVTNAEGYYRFTGLPPGKYSVEFHLPLGYSFSQSSETLGDIQFDGLPIASADGSYLVEDVTSDANIDTGKTEQVDVVSGDVNLSLDAGIYIPAKIAGLVFHDLNANGIREEGEEGIEGAVVTLFNSASTSSGVAVAVSDATGEYTFEGLLPGSYYGFFEPPSEEYFMSPTGQGGDPETDSDFDPDLKTNSMIALLSGDDDTSAFDAGLYKHASVGNFVWLDAAADGIQGTEEIGFPFPVTINLYNTYNEVLASTVSNETGFYLFEELIPGYYEIEFILEEGDILSPPFRGDNQELDSNVDPTTKRAEVTLVSGEDNFSVDAGIIADAPYYPDWTWDVQVCTNDGFDPEWMTSNNEGEQIYLYRNKEECCQNHFWWRMAQCMANEEYKFYRNGEICDSKIDFEDWESNSPAEWTDTKLFDTLDECCAELFSYDYSGCMERSPVMFKFDFCFDIGSLLPPIDCQTADIYANVLEDAINLGIGDASDANITRIGDASLTKVDGSTQCGGSLEGQDFINDLTGTISRPDLSDLPNSTAVCGVITTESYDCTEDECLDEIYQNIVNSLTAYANDGSLTSNLNSLATSRLPPVEELQVAYAISGSLSAYNLLLPSTISTQLGDLKYFKDNDSCGQKTAFASWEIKYDTLLDCCSANFNWQLDDCCAEGGGCGLNDPSTTTTTATTTSSTTENPGTTTSTSSTTVQTTTENPGTTTSSTVQTTTDNPGTTTTTSSTAQTTTENPGTTTSTSSTVQTTTENPGTTTTTSSTTAQTTTENPVTTTTSTVQTTTENPATTTTTSSTTAQTTTEAPVLRFFADQSYGAEKLCDLKPLSSFESWEVAYTELKDCCTDKFSWDYANCCNGEGLGGCGDPPPTTRYYPTWQDGKLCEGKTSFEGWEQTYDTLKKCCTSHFGYSYDACCQAEGMGGCV